MSSPILSSAWRKALVLASMTLAMEGALAAGCADAIDVNADLLNNGYAHGLDNNRHKASPIDSSNVANLSVAYVHAEPGVKERRGTPAVTKAVIYAASGEYVVALNRNTGCTYWRYHVPGSTSLKPNTVRSGSVYLIRENPRLPLVLAGDFNGVMHALNARTGEKVWSRQLINDSIYTLTGSFQYHNGTLYVPISSTESFQTLLQLNICCTSHGMLVALDPYTGTERWVFHTGAKATYNASTGQMAPSGMSIWGTPAIDRKRNLVIVGTGQAFSQPASEHSDAVIAIDASTGKKVWSYQGEAGDAWNVGCQTKWPLSLKCPKVPGEDHDFGGAPIMMTTLANGRDVVIAGQKSGVVHAIDPDNGQAIWRSRVSAGANDGGVHWALSTDGQRVYAGTTDLNVAKSVRLSLYGTLAATQSLSKDNYLVPNARPGVYALDLQTGTLLWSRQFTHEYQGATYPSTFSAGLTVTNDVLFAGAMDGMLYALRTTDGATLWAFNSAGQVTDVDGQVAQGGSIDSVGAVVAGGDVLLNSGYSTLGGESKYQGGYGNSLYVFRLPK
jgi:polyvinyl alcohol dehydrogenase (cytochrome)